MKFVADEMQRGDPLAEAVVPESVKHARTARLVAQVAILAVAGSDVEAVERLGLRWPDKSVSAPDFFLLPGGVVDFSTTSYVVDKTGPKPLVAVEVVVDSSPDIIDLVRRGVTTYLVYVDHGQVWRFDPELRSVNLVADREVCPELGIAFVRGIGAVGVVDSNGREWYDPDEHLRSLARGAAERDAAVDERDAAIGERDAALERTRELEDRIAALEAAAPEQQR